MGMGVRSAKTQPLLTQALHQQAQTANLTAQIKSAVQSLDPKDLEALVKELQTKHPQLATLLQNIVNTMPSTQNVMSLGEISGKHSSHGAHHGAHHGSHGGTGNLPHALKTLLDDIKKKQETASPSDSSAGAQGQGQQQNPPLHMAQDTNEIQGGFKSYLN